MGNLGERSACGQRGGGPRRPDVPPWRRVRPGDAGPFGWRALCARWS